MKYSLFISVLLLTIFANSQVVNIEKQRKDVKSGWQGDLDFGLNFTKSTSNIIQGKNSLKMQHHKDRNTYLFFNDISLMKVDENNLINSGFLHLRYNYDFLDSIFIVEGFTQIQYNTIQKLQRRFLWGGGMRYRFVEKDNLNIFAGTGIMYEFELLSLSDSLGEKYNNHDDNIRVNLYLSTGFKINSTASLTHITYYQPVINNFSDFRLSSESSLNLKVSKKISIRIFFNLFYDSTPPEQVQPTFFSLNNGLRYSF